jgi:hypothetical protein
MESQLVEKSYYVTSGVSVQEFQEKLKKEDWWGKVGYEFDQKRLMEPGSWVLKTSSFLNLKNDF